MFVFDRVFAFDLRIYKVDGLAVFLSFVCFYYSKKKTVLLNLPKVLCTYADTTQKTVT